MAKSKPTAAASGTDVGLEVTATVIRALQTVAGASPIPGLAQAANLALLITMTVQKARANKGGYEMLAGDARDLVYVIYQAYQGVEKEEDMPPGLGDKLGRVHEVLSDVQECAERGMRRSRFSALCRSGADAGKIVDARQQMQQCLTLFGFAANINLQVEVHKQVAQQDKMMGMLEGKAGKGGGGPEAGARAAGPTALHAGSNSVVTYNHDVGNVVIGGRVNKDNRYSVHLGQGVSFAGATGINIGSSL